VAFLDNEFPHLAVMVRMGLDHVIFLARTCLAMSVGIEPCLPSTAPWARQN